MIMILKEKNEENSNSNFCTYFPEFSHF